MQTDKWRMKERLWGFCSRRGGQEGTLTKFQVIQSKRFKETSWIYAQPLITIFLFHLTFAVLGRKVNHTKNRNLGNDHLKCLQNSVRAYESSQKVGEAVRGTALPRLLKIHISKTLPSAEAVFLRRPHSSARIPKFSSPGVQKLLLEKGPMQAHLHTHICRHTDIHTHTHIHTDTPAYTYIHIHTDTRILRHIMQTHTDIPHVDIPAHTHKDIHIRRHTHS